MWPPSIAIRPRNTGDIALSVSSPLARPKHAAATALAREIGGVRQEAPSVRNMAIKSPRGSTTDTLILAPIAITLAFAAARICSASASVKDAIGCSPCVCIDRMGAVRRHPADEGVALSRLSVVGTHGVSYSTQPTEDTSGSSVVVCRSQALSR